MTESCKFCGSFYRVVGGICVYCALGWVHSIEQEELDAIERPVAQDRIAAERGAC